MLTSIYTRLQEVKAKASRDHIVKELGAHPLRIRHREVGRHLVFWPHCTAHCSSCHSPLGELHDTGL
eukprot:5376657-Amphidinium_carterae.1